MRRRLGQDFGHDFRRIFVTKQLGISRFIMNIVEPRPSGRLKKGLARCRWLLDIKGTSPHICKDPALARYGLTRTSRNRVPASLYRTCMNRAKLDFFPDKSPPLIPKSKK